MRSATRRAVPLPADVEILDTSEQSAILAELSALQQTQNRRWRRRLAAAGLCLATCLSYAAAAQVQHPWQLVVHAHLYGALPTSAVVLADALAALAVLLASFALLRSQPELQRVTDARLKVAGALALLSSAVYALGVGRVFAHADSVASRQHAARLLWLPLPPLYAVLCAAAESSLRDTAAQLAALSRVRYDHKTL